MYTKERGSSNIELRRGDITMVVADAIVNAANSALAPGAGVCGAILRAGGQSIFDECARIGGCPTGSAVITAAGTLPAKHVIHAVAPRYSGSAADAELLRSAYAASLRIALERGLSSVAFPSLGTGIYGYPIEEAARIALDTAITHLRSHRGIDRVIFVLFSEHDHDVFARTLSQADK